MWPPWLRQACCSGIKWSKVTIKWAEKVLDEMFYIVQTKHMDAGAAAFDGLATSQWWKNYLTGTASLPSHPLASCARLFSLSTFAFGPTHAGRTCQRLLSSPRSRTSGAQGESFPSERLPPVWTEPFNRLNTNSHTWLLVHHMFSTFSSIALWGCSLEPFAEAEP